jgi:O-succinylbenzoic acid--CoA ligase
MLVSGGHRVHPQEVEDRLAACPGVTEVVVTGTPDPVWGHVITAWVTGAADAAAVEAWARAELPSRLRPRRVHHLPDLPRLPSGKPDRTAIQNTGTRW